MLECYMWSAIILTYNGHRSSSIDSWCINKGLDCMWYLSDQDQSHCGSKTMCPNSNFSLSEDEGWGYTSVIYLQVGQLLLTSHVSTGAVYNRTWHIKASNVSTHETRVYDCVV